MPPESQWLMLGLIVVIIITTVRKRYMQALETGQTRSGTPLRDYTDLRNRFLTRVLWCFFPGSAIAVWIWINQQKYTVAILTVIITGSIAIGGAIFDACLLRAWAKREKNQESAGKES